MRLDKKDMVLYAVTDRHWLNGESLYSQVEKALKEAFDLKKPVVVDCRISPDDNVLPMIPPGGPVDQMITQMD